MHCRCNKMAANEAASKSERRVRALHDAAADLGSAAPSEVDRRVALLDEAELELLAGQGWAAEVM